MQMSFLHVAANKLVLAPPYASQSPLPSQTLEKLQIKAAAMTTHYMRDGEVVLYLRPRSSVWQMRFKLYDRAWRRMTTKQHRLDWAMKAAGEIYDRARFREEAGLPQVTRRFDAVAKECLKTIAIETGLRCGKESMNMLWKHIEWYEDPKTKQRYIRILVSGKIGGRWLIAKHIAAEAFGRLGVRQGVGTDIESAIAMRSEMRVFRLSSGQQPASLQTTFKWLMRDCGLAKDATTNQQRTLYSLRHTYATLSLMDGQMDMHMLAKQMGTSIAMLEQHYSKMTATMAAKRLA